MSSYNPTDTEVIALEALADELEAILDNAHIQKEQVATDFTQLIEQTQEGLDAVIEAISKEAYV